MCDGPSKIDIEQWRAVVPNSQKFLIEGLEPDHVRNLRI